MKIPSVILDYAEKLEANTAKKYPALAGLAKQCYLNTIETTVKQCENGDWFVITGDIPNEDVGRIVACMKDGVMESIAPLLVQFGSYRKSHLIRPVTLEQMADKYKKEGI